MGEYFISLFVSCAAVALLSYLSYPGASERTVKIAAGILMIYSVVSPLAVLAGELSSFDPEDFFAELGEYSPSGGEEYIEVTKEAFAEGIAGLLSSKYGIKKEDISVTVFDLDFEKMQAGKIKIVLSGKGAAADYRAVRAYVSSLNVGECEVKIELGK